jgi:hypothetical protein
VEIKIGVQHTGREVVLESTSSAEDVFASVTAAVGGGTVLSLTDDKGRTVLVPGDKIAYVEIGAVESRRVGFGTG